MKYLVIYWMWVHWTISIPYEKFHFYDFTKNIWMKFFIQTNITMLKKKVIEKNYFRLKDNKNNARGFVSTFILYVYQNARWNLKNLTPK